MKSRIFSIVVFICASSVLLAQPKFKFDEETYDFGNIKEEDGSVEHKFIFTNTGDAPLVIQGVRASCGCTTPAWTKEPVVPGDKGFVMAKYNPKNRPGTFRKSLNITSNADPATKVIYIKGMVEVKPRSTADRYRYKIGDTRFKYQTMNMGKVTTEKPLTRTFEIYNEGEKPITLSAGTKKLDHLTISFQPNVLEPKAIAKMVITYDAVAKKDFGFVSDPIRIYTDEESDAEKSLRVVATIEEYFGPMTQEELAKAPKLAFVESEHDFGDIRKNVTVSTEFIFTNTGQSDLNIRALKPNCGCTISKLDKYDYAPGESGKILVDFNSTGRKGRQQKSVVIFSNDPSAPTQRLIIKAKVEDVS